MSLADQVKKMAARLHCVDEQLVAAVESENHEFQKPTMAVETHDELLCGHVVVWPALVDSASGACKASSVLTPCFDAER